MPVRPSMKDFLRHALLTLAVLGVFGVAAATIVVLGGVYDISALHQHSAPVYELLELAQQRSAEVRAHAIDPPPLDDPALLDLGFRVYRDKCAQCHGAPGVARHDIGAGMLPLPPNLVQTAREKPPRYIYWVVTNGIKMTGMPAWQFRLDDRARWSVAAFVRRLPELSPEEYARMARATGENGPTSSAGAGP